MADGHGQRRCRSERRLRRLQSRQYPGSDNQKQVHAIFHRGNSHNRGPDHANLIGDALNPSHNFGGVKGGKQAARKDQDQWSGPTEK